MTLLAFNPETVRAPSQLSADKLHLGYRDRKIVHDLSVKIPPHKFTVVVGANACGKSTLLRGLARLLAPSEGTVLLDGKSIHQMPTRDVAQKMGLLPQTPVAPQSILVADLVGRGRYPHQGWFRRWSAEDEVAVAAALDATDTADLVARPLRELSGGQRQRVWVAMTLAQDTDILLLDEPTTFLDLNHQVELLRLLRSLNAKTGKTIVVVLHELNLATRFSDHIIAMTDGRLVAQGSPSEVVTAERIREVFGLECVVVPDPTAGTPLVVPL